MTRRRCSCGSSGWSAGSGWWPTAVRPEALGAPPNRRQGGRPGRTPGGRGARGTGRGARRAGDRPRCPARRHRPRCPRHLHLPRRARRGCRPRPPPRHTTSRDRRRPSRAAGGDVDAAGLRQVWDQVLAAVRGRKRTTEALLAHAQVTDVRGSTWPCGSRRATSRGCSQPGSTRTCWPKRCGRSSAVSGASSSRAGTTRAGRPTAAATGRLATAARPRPCRAGGARFGSVGRARNTRWAGSPGWRPGGPGWRPGGPGRRPGGPGRRLAVSRATCARRALRRRLPRRRPLHRRRPVRRRPVTSSTTRPRRIRASAGPAGHVDPHAQAMSLLRQGLGARVLQDSGGDLPPS